MSHPGYGAIFKRIRQVAGSEALKLARTMEKTTYKLEAHHRHLQFTHKALENHWTPKSLRFKPPGNHPMFKKHYGTGQQTLYASTNLYLSQQNPSSEKNARRIQTAIIDLSHRRHLFHASSILN